MSAAATPTPDIARRMRRTALACAALALGMVGVAFASVPLYNLFCRITGYDGTPAVGTAGASRVVDRTITVRFDANVIGGLPWKFQPEQTAINVKIGDVFTVYYRVTNESARETAGNAAYNVTPLTAGAYFQKINCFCFTEQRLKPGETRDMPVVFYVDPALVNDADQRTLDTITLSYSFYPVRQSKPLAQAPAGANGRI